MDDRAQSLRGIILFALVVLVLLLTGFIIFANAPTPDVGMVVSV